jgi:hypothetical protein
MMEKIPEASICLKNMLSSDQYILKDAIVNHDARPGGVPIVGCGGWYSLDFWWYN